MAIKHGMSTSSYLLHCFHVSKNISNKVHYIEKSSKEKGIERIKRTKMVKNSDIQHIPDDIRNTIKNMFKTKSVKDILKEDV